MNAIAEHLVRAVHFIGNVDCADFFIREVQHFLAPDANDVVVLDCYGVVSHALVNVRELRDDAVPFKRRERLVDRRRRNGGMLRLDPTIHVVRAWMRIIANKRCVYRQSLWGKVQSGIFAPLDKAVNLLLSGFVVQCVGPALFPVNIGIASGTIKLLARLRPTESCCTNPCLNEIGQGFGGNPKPCLQGTEKV